MRTCCEYHHALDEGSLALEERSYRCCHMSGYVPANDPRSLRWSEQLGCWVATKLSLELHLSMSKRYDHPNELCYSASIRHEDDRESWTRAAIYAVHALNAEPAPAFEFTNTEVRHQW